MTSRRSATYCAGYRQYRSGDKGLKESLRNQRMTLIALLLTMISPGRLYSTQNLVTRPNIDNEGGGQIYGKNG